MKQRLKVYIFLVTVISLMTLIFTEYYLRKIDEEIDIHNTRVGVLFNAHEVLYHIIAIQEGLYRLHFGTIKTDEPIKRHITELDEGMANLSRTAGYIYYSGKADDLFKTYLHHVEVVEAMYPGFINKVKAVLTAGTDIEREPAIKEAIEKTEGIEVILNEIEKFMDNEFKLVSKSLPALTGEMRRIRNISGTLLFIAVVVSAYFMFRSCSTFRKLKPFMRSVKEGDYSCPPEFDAEEECGAEIIAGINKVIDKLTSGNNSTGVLAITDPLTDAYNRRYFDMRINDEMNRCIRYGTIFSLSIIDLDHFKDINDTFGHQVGDSVLKELIVIIKDTVRETDIVARYGGEEFVVIYPSTPKSGVLTQLERLRKSVEEYKFTDINRPVTISVGAADSAGKDDAGKVLQEADSSLYVAKRNGRNQCVIAGVTT